MDGFTGGEYKKQRKNHGGKKGSGTGGKVESMEDDDSGSYPPDNNNIVRKEMGLEWMLRPKANMEENLATTSDQLEELQSFDRLLVSIHSCVICWIPIPN
ncbi:hypothetical protein U1Q18_025712 [Sarracenia purpurea var. burkii]